MKKKIKLFSIVLNYSRPKETINAVKSLQKQEGEFKQQIVVVDNSEKGNISLKEFEDQEDIHLIKIEKNLGYSKGNNRGIEYALEKEADYVLLLNDDAYLSKDCIDKMLKIMEKSKNTGIASPKIFFAPGYEYHKKKYEKDDKGKVIWYAGGVIDWDNILASHQGVDKINKSNFDKIEKTDFASGCVMLIKAEVFNKIGLLDPKYFMYWEDVDFCQRAKQAGYKVIYIGKAEAWHKNLGTVKGEENELKEKYMAWSRLLFAFKYAPLKTKLLLMKKFLSTWV